MKVFQKITALLLAVIILISMTSELALNAQASDSYETDILAEKEHFAENAEAIMDCLMEMVESSDLEPSEISEIIDVFQQITNAFDTDIQPNSGVVFASAPYPYAETTIKVGSKKLKNATYDPFTGTVSCDFLQIFKALGGKVKIDKKAGAVLYELNGIRKAHTLIEDPKDYQVSVAYVINMFEVTRYFDFITTETFQKKYGTTPCITVEHKRNKEKMPKPVKVKFTQSVKEFFTGTAVSVVEDVQSGFWTWLMKLMTGLNVQKPPKPASLKDPQAYYIGRVVGHVLSIAIGAGESIIGAMAIVGSLGAGGFTTVMSGGTLTIAGVAISAAGVTVGGAMAADGSLVAARAMATMGDDFNRFIYFSKSNWSQASSKVTVKYHGKNVNVYRGGKDFTVRSIDVEVNSKGLVTSKKGVSLNIDPMDANIVKYGGAYRIESLPKGLKIIQQGKVEHFEIVPTSPMQFEEFQRLLNQIVVSGPY